LKRDLRLIASSLEGVPPRRRPGAQALAIVVILGLVALAIALAR
jgi:hypothetical protein